MKIENKRLPRQVCVEAGESGWKLRTSSTDGDKTVYLFIPGMWHTDSFATFGMWPRYVASMPGTASATLVLRGRSTVNGVASHENSASLNDYVDDIKEAFMLLARSFDRIVMCGHSMGGLLVHLTTQSLHESVRGKLAAVITLCESTSVVPRMAWNAITSRSFSEILAGEPFCPHPDDVEKYIIRAGWNLPHRPVLGHESGVAARQLLLGRYSLNFNSTNRPRVPHLVVGSVNDPIVPCQATKKTYRRMIDAGMDAHHYTVVPGGHMIMLCKKAEHTIENIYSMATSLMAQREHAARVVCTTQNLQRLIA